MGKKKGELTIFPELVAVDINLGAIDKGYGAVYNVEGERDVQACWDVEFECCTVFPD